MEISDLFSGIVEEGIRSGIIDATKAAIKAGWNGIVFNINSTQSPQDKDNNTDTGTGLMLVSARNLCATVDQIRFPGFTGCSCHEGRCSQFQCGQRHRQVILCRAINNLHAQVSHIPFSNTLAHQYIKNIKIQVAELLTGIDKYASGTRNLDVLAINYQIDELDAFQQRFKDSIIGLEHCLA